MNNLDTKQNCSCCHDHTCNHGPISPVGRDVVLWSRIEEEIKRAKDAESNKIDLLGNEQVSGEPYHFPYYFTVEFDNTSRKLKGKVWTITLDNNKTLSTAEYEVIIPGGGEPETYLKRATTEENTLFLENKDGSKVIYTPNLDSKLDLLGYVPGHEAEKLAYNLPYFFSTIVESDKITVKANTISLDNKKIQGEYHLDILCATLNKAGLMSSADKNKLEELYIRTYEVDGGLIE